MAADPGFKVYGCCALARQGQIESDLCISMRCVNSMSDDIVVFDIVFSLDRAARERFTHFN